MPPNREAWGKPSPPTEATVEAGHLQRFVEAIGDPNPRWKAEAPPTFLVALAGMLALAAALYRVELLGKRLDQRLRELRELLA